MSATQRVSAIVVTDHAGSVSLNAFRPERVGSAARTIAGEADVSAYGWARRSAGCGP